MKDKPWSGLHYVDLFAGSGVERLDSSGDLDWGSPLLAAQATYSFSRLHVCEKNREKFNALSKRLASFDLPAEPQVLCGDANVVVHDIVAEIPARSLSLAFLDPFGLHLDFETLRALSRRRADLIIFFPDHFDALRNCEYYYEDNPSSNLDRVLGKGADWRGQLAAKPRHQRAQILKKLYTYQIGGLGYSCFDYERISYRGHPYYLLIFCSHSATGGKIWRRVSNTKPDGQRTLDFPD